MKLTAISAINATGPYQAKGPIRCRRSGPTTDRRRNTTHSATAEPGRPTKRWTDRKASASWGRSAIMKALLPANR